MSKFKKFLSVLCCLIIVFTSFSVVYASDYNEYDSDESDNNPSGATYYINDTSNFESLWDFGLGDVADGFDLFGWIFNWHTFTVIKSYTDSDGQLVYRGYFNTPNLQQLLKNEITNLFDQGYTDATYDVNDTEWLVNVGWDAESDNVITRYGFSIPNYIYSGEYPQETLSVAGILPTTWYDSVWRAVKSLFGASFLKAPDASNFNTITYLNHGYSDSEDYLVEFIRQYYIPYFISKVGADTTYTNSFVDDYFSDVEDLIAETVTEQQCNSAEDYLDIYEEEYIEYSRMEAGYNIFSTSGGESDTDLMGNTLNYNAFFNMDEDSINRYLGISGDMGSVGGGDEFDEIEIGIGHGETADCSDADMTYDDLLEFVSSSDRYRQALRDWWQNGPGTQAARAAYLYSVILADEDNILYDEMMDDFGGNWNSTGSEVIDRFDGYFMSDTDIDEIIEAVFLKTNPQGHYYFLWGDGDDPEMDTYGHATVTIPGDPILDEEGEETGEYEPDTTLEFTVASRTANFYFCTTDGRIDSVNYPSLWDVIGSINGLTVSTFDWQETDWVDDSQRLIMNRYEDMNDLTMDYDSFIEKINNANEADDFTVDGPMRGIPYTQCLIQNTNQDDENACESNIYGDTTTITLMDLYAYGGLYRMTPDFSLKQHWENNPNISNTYWRVHPDIYEDYNTLTEEGAQRVISFIKTYSGPYYSEVISNMVSIILLTAQYDSDTNPAEYINDEDVRVMPYDLTTLYQEDAENFGISDPRVDIYKKQVIGSFLSMLSVQPFNVIFYVRPQNALLSIIGKITEFSVFMQQLCNFDILDDLGLSPTFMWTSSFAMLVIGFLALLFVFKTVSSAFAVAMNRSSSPEKVFIAFLILFLELGFLTLLAVKPEQIWTFVKNADTKIINLGEMATVYNNPNLSYLYGDAEDMEVTYYMPYLDAWSKYNTGYGILDNEQVIDYTADLPELKKFDPPTLGSNNIGHWSVLLMDSFEYHGYSNSALNATMVQDGDTFRSCNGPIINNNAYRVVDHFLAPRISYTLNDDSSLSMSVTTNENYNGEFQSGFVELIVKLIVALFMCFLSLLKVLTFFWQWYMFYIFVFKVVLDKANKLPWSKVLLVTFSPTAALVLLGTYAGLSLNVLMRLEGVIGLIIIVALFILTFNLLAWWSKLGNGDYFPSTLKWIVILTDRVKEQVNKAADNKDDDYDEQWAAIQNKYRNDKRYKEIEAAFNSSNKTHSLAKQKELVEGLDPTDRKYDELRAAFSKNCKDYNNPERLSKEEAKKAHKRCGYLSKEEIEACNDYDNKTRFYDTYGEKYDKMVVSQKASKESASANTTTVTSPEDEKYKEAYKHKYDQYEEAKQYMDDFADAHKSDINFSKINSVFNGEGSTIDDQFKALYDPDGNLVYEDDDYGMFRHDLYNHYLNLQNKGVEVDKVIEKAMQEYETSEHFDSDAEKYYDVWGKYNPGEKKRYDERKGK